MKKLSLKVTYLIAILFAIQSFSTLRKFNSGEKTCICAYDGFGYYMYLPALFNNHSLDIKKEWAQQLQNEYCNGITAYQLIQQENGKNIDLYHMGLSYLQLPSYTVSHFFAKSLGYKTDGFSPPFIIGFVLNAFIFIIIGLIYLRKLLLLFSNDKIVALSLLTLYLASNIFITFTLQKDLPHLYIFALNSIFLYHLFQFSRQKKKKFLIFSAIIFGITVAIRPTQALLGLTPLILLWRDSKDYKILFNQLIYFPMFALIWNLPQIAYWYFIGGKLFIPNLHTEELIIIDPNLFNFLFSFRKGWIIYSPIFILSFIGFYFLFRSKKTLFWSTFPTSILYIFIMSSWECWWYAGSYGSRAMTDIYPFLTIPFAYLITNTQRTQKIILLSLFTSIAIILNVIQSYQYNEGIIHYDRMSKEQYFHVFGKISKSNFNDDRLLIDRNNTDWINSIRNTKLYTIKKQTLVNIKTPKLFSSETKDLGIAKFELLPKIKSDETRIDVEFKVNFKQGFQKSAFLQLETCSQFNCYDWQTVEILKDDSIQNSKVFKYSFNLRDIRHYKDILQVYIYNPNNITFVIEYIKIDAETALRK